MNIYDTANNLAREIKDSNEYKQYAKIKKSISENKDKKSKLEEFEKIRYSTQLEAMQGKTQDENVMKNLQETYMKLIEDEEIKEYFDAEMKFNVMIADVNKIIAEAVKDVL